MHSIVNKAEALEEQYERIKDIVDLIMDRTPAGSEEFVYKKINSMFNGMNK
jgi:hypothetical protein